MSTHQCISCKKPLKLGKRSYPSHYYRYGHCTNVNCSMCDFEQYLGQTLKRGWKYIGTHIVRSK